MSSKRPRVASTLPRSSSESPSPEPEPTPKALRTSRPTPGIGHPLLCTLPPTCNHKPTPIANSKELESHYAIYHAHVCAEPGCSCVFPEPKLLELHQTECHDPLAAIRQERGEKIFGCLVNTCGKYFATPKTRRLHLIHGHGYPKEYFFAVTNKGVGGLLKKWGEGASMIRGQWKNREEDKSKKIISEEEEDEDEDEESEEQTEVVDEPEETTPKNSDGRTQDDLDGLADTMSSLSLVPKSIRFGRGGRGGFVSHDSHVRGGRGSKRARGARANPAVSQGNAPDDSVMDVDVTPARGRGRGTFFPRGRVLRGGFRGAPRGNFNPGRGRGGGN